MMANEQNLKPVKTKKEARERGRKGGIKSGEVRRARRTLKDELLLLLSKGQIQENITLALIKEALEGQNKTKAYEVIRDTIGEKPTEKVEADVKNEVNINIELSDE